MNKKEYLKEILKYTPSGAQTLSKNPTQYVVGVTPLTIDRAKGVYLWDEDGKKYLDTVLALGPMIFGYANKRIDRAVKKQIGKGTIFTLPSPYEFKLAKLLKEVVPCAEMSKFVMDGNDATTGAVRLARYITKRDHVAKCGYHGYQDWSICTKDGRNNGVPEMMKTLTHDFKYNDVASLEKIFKDYPNQIAAVILEPVSSEEPKDNFLQKIKDVAHKYGAIFIFDEMVTGFRWALGGAQEYFGVTPDLACFGKAMSDGYPLSIISGKKEYMDHMDEVFVSTTFSGWVPSLVAAIETITMMKEFGDVHKHMHTLGKYLIEGGNKLSKKFDMPVEFIGYGPHPLMTIKITDDYENRLFKSYIYQHMNRAGIIFSTSMMIGYAHTKKHMNFILRELKKVYKELAGMKDFKEIKNKLDGEVVAPRTVRLVQ